MGNRHINIPVFIPHKGCPNTCVFCDQRRISGTISSPTFDSVKKLIEDSLSTIKDSEVEVAFFGGSFTGIPESDMIGYLETVKPFIESGRVQGIRLSTRPDYINNHIIGILKEYGVTAIELGVQSLDPEVLKKSKRGHSVADVENACAIIRDSGIKLGIQTMLGLPGDTFSKALDTAYKVVSIKPEMVRIYPALVLKDTELEELYKSGSYMPLSVEEAVDWCAAIVPLYKSKGITVLRIGLHSSEDMESSIVAGPYHPAFGELVESRILLNRILQELKKREPLIPGKIVIRTRPELVSKIIGHGRTNIDAIKNKYPNVEVKVLADLKTGDFEIQNQ